MIRHTLLAAAVAALVVALAGPFGVGALAAAPAPAQASLQGTVSHAGGSADLVVYVETAPGAFTPPAARPVIDQKGMKFFPHTLPVVVGTTVEFLNSDSVNHNVFSPDGEGFNLGTWAKGEKRTYTFTHTGSYTLLCSIHPEMEAYIVVVQNPYYAVTDANGHFKINLPAGHYALMVWGEHLKSKDTKRTFPVDVAAGGSSTTITF